MICTVTMNAAIDRAYWLDRPLRVGEVQRVAEVRDSAGGKGLNCARAVRTLGEEVLATGFVAGHAGRRLVELLDADGVPSEFVEVAGETRFNLNVIDASGASTELLEPGPIIAPADLERLIDLVGGLARRADAVTLNGSVPQGVPTAIYAELTARIREAGTPVVLDTSAELLRVGIEARPTVVKPNGQEIAQILGRPTTGLRDVADAAVAIRRRGIRWVVVSLGGDGALLASEEGVFRGTPPTIEVANPVGSGDTMVGALAVALVRAMGPAEALAFAMARASANCLSPETGSFDESIARKLQDLVSVTRLDA